MSRPDYPDPDDMFADTRMTFGEHIEDLRTHMIRAIYGFVAGMVLAFFFARTILGWITGPVDKELLAYHKRNTVVRLEKLRKETIEQGLANLPQVHWKGQQRRVRPAVAVAADPKAALPSLVPALLAWIRDLGLDDLLDPVDTNVAEWEDIELRFPDPLAMAKDLQDLQYLTKPPSLTSLSIQEPFVVFFKIAIMAGFVISSPIVFYQLWAFVAAGLYPSEKRLVRVYLPISLGLFFIGVIACQFIVIPKAVAALLWFNEWLEIQPDLRLNEWLGFAIFMPVVFGLSFQTPLVMLFTYMIGLFDIQTFREKRKIAFFLMAVFAALITPSTDAFSMMFMWLPMCFLYEVGIWMCIFKKREEKLEWEEDESRELIEV